jgi:hypothetical protein
VKCLPSHEVPIILLIPIEQKITKITKNHIILFSNSGSIRTTAHMLPSIYTVAEGVLFTFSRVDRQMGKRRNLLRKHGPFTLR